MQILNARKSVLGRWLRRIGYAVAAIIVLLACAYVTRDAWSKAALEAAVESSEHALALDDLEWTGMHRLEISGVRYSSTDAAATVQALRVERAIVEFDLWTLWREGWRGISSIETDGVEAVLDVSAGAPSESGTTGEGFDISTLTPLPRVDLKRTHVEVRLAPTQSIAIRDASLVLGPQARGAAPETDIELHVREAEFRDGDRLVAHPASLRATWRAGVIDLRELTLGNEIRATSGLVDLTHMHRGRIDADVDLAVFGGHAAVALRLADEHLALRVSADSVNLAHALHALLADPALALDAALDFDLDISIPLAAPSATRGTVRLDAFDIRIGERRIDWLRASVAAREHTLDVPELFLAQGENRVVIRDFSIPRDALDMCGLRERASAQLEAELEDLPRALGEAASRAGTPDLADHRLRLAGRLAGGALELDRGQLTVGRDRVRLRRGYVPLDVVFDETSKLDDVILDPRFELDLVVRTEDLARVTAAFGVSDWEGSIEAAVRVSGSPKGPRGFADVQARDLRVLGREVGSLSAHCELDRDRLEVSHLALEGPDANIELEGRYFWEERRFEDARAHAWVRDLSTLGVESAPRGAIEIEADWRGAGRELEGSLTVRSEELEWADAHMARVAVHARVAPASTEFALRVVDRDLGTVESIGRIDGALADVLETRELCFYLRDFRWLDTVELLALSKPVECVIAPHNLVISDFDLSGRSGTLRASLVADAEALRVKVMARTLEITPWLSRFVAASAQCKTMNADVEASWSAGSMSVDAVGTFEGVRWSETSPEAALDVALGLHGTRATVQRLHAYTSDGARIELSGAFPLDVFGDVLLPEGDLLLTGNLSVPALERVVPPDDSVLVEKRGSVTAGLDIRGTWAEPLGTLSVQARDVTNVFGKASSGVGPGGLDFALELGAEVVVRRAEVTLLNGAHAELTGRVAAPLNVSELAKSGLESFEAAPLDLHVVLELPDLAPLAAVLPNLRRMGGGVRGSFDVRGSVAEPDMRGAVDLSSGELRLAAQMPSLTGLDARLTLDGDRVEIERLDGEMGGAPVHLRGSVSNWTEKPVLDIALNGENVLLYRTIGFVLRADADLAVRGPIDALTVDGVLSMRDSRYTRDFDLLSIGKSGSAAPSVTRGHALFELEAPLDTMTFDVRLRAGEPFVIRNNVVRASLRPELTLGGTGAVPLLRGTIFVDPGRVSLPTGTAYVRSGRIDYTAADPFVPDVEGLAEMRLQGYDITMRVSGDLEEPEIDVSSLPPLSREDLMLLVLTNRPPGEQLTLKSGQRAAADVAAFIARDVISNWFDHGVTDADESWADSLEVETGEEVSDTGVDTVRARLRLLKGRLGERANVYLTGERDVYDHYNFGLRFLFRFQ